MNKVNTEDAEKMIEEDRHSPSLRNIKGNNIVSK